MENKIQSIVGNDLFPFVINAMIQGIGPSNKLKNIISAHIGEEGTNIINDLKLYLRRRYEMYRLVHNIRYIDFLSLYDNRISALSYLFLSLKNRNNIQCYYEIIIFIDNYLNGVRKEITQ